METDIFFPPFFFYQNNFGPCQHTPTNEMASLTGKKKKVISVKIWNTKGIQQAKTPQDINYWHFPCVMLCTLPFLFYSYNTFYNM